MELAPAPVAMAVRIADVELAKPTGSRNQFAASQDSDTHCVFVVEANRSRLGFHMTVLARAVMVFVGGKPRDCMVDARKSYCCCSESVDCIAAELVAGTVTACEQIAADCM